MSKKKSKKSKVKMVEVARSFSYKLNAGNFESRDFFCSQKAECKESEADKVSEALHQFCKNEVIRAVNEYLEARARAQGDKIQTGEIDHKKNKDVAKETVAISAGELADGYNNESDSG